MTASFGGMRNSVHSFNGSACDLRRGDRYPVRNLLVVGAVVKRFRIALADAFHDEAEMYAASLAPYGFEVHPIETANVVRASEIILRLYPDAVVTRILPGRFGIELVRVLRTNVVMTTVPMVILTSLAHTPLLEEARCCGATEVLLLPVTADEIANLLRRHLRSQRSA